VHLAKMVVSDRRLGRGRQHREEEMWEKRGMFGHSKVEFCGGKCKNCGARPQGCFLRPLKRAKSLYVEEGDDRRKVN